MASISLHAREGQQACDLARSADEEGRWRTALAAMLETFEQPEMSIDFEFAPGEIQFVDNRTLGHSRTEFEDWPDPDRRRHLVRLWLRDHGKRGYCG